MRYRILKVIGCGGQGRVYLAEGGVGKVTLKEVGGEEATGRQPKEAAEFEGSRLKEVPDHRNLVKFIDVVEEGEVEDPNDVRKRAGGWFTVMSHVSGPTLAKYPRFGELGSSAWWQLLSQIFDGINHMHRHNLIHRDLKPANIIIGTVDGQPRPVVVDVGLAKRAQSDKTQLLGETPKYAPPESRDPALAGQPSYDIYQLALISFEAMHGDGLYDRHYGWDTSRMQGHLRRKGRPFESALADGLEKDPVRRPQSIWDWIKSMVSVQLPERVDDELIDEDTEQEPEDRRLDSMIAEIMGDQNWTKKKLLEAILEFGVFSSAESPDYQRLANMRSKRSILIELKADYPDKFIEGFWTENDEQEGPESAPDRTISSLIEEIERDFQLPQGSLALVKRDNSLIGGGTLLRNFCEQQRGDIWVRDDHTLADLATNISQRFRHIDQSMVKFLRPGSGSRKERMYPTRARRVRTMKSDHGVDV